MSKRTEEALRSLVTAIDAARAENDDGAWRFRTILIERELADACAALDTADTAEPERIVEAAIALAREHVGELMFDSLDAPEMDCALCKIAEAFHLWEEWERDSDNPTMAEVRAETDGRIA